MTADPAEHGLVGLFHGFEGHRAPRAEEIDGAIATAMISIDANVMLGLYRYPDEFSAALLEALDSMVARVFVTHQALVEFWRNRTSALADRSRAKAEIEKRLGHCERSVTDAIETWAKQTTLDESDLQQARILVTREFEVLRKLVADTHRDDVESYPSPGMDPIVRALEGLLDRRAGPPLTATEYDAAVAEGGRRHAKGEPPGYKEKTSEKEHLPEGVSGDYLVWSQSLAEAKRRGSDLLIITGDEKEDWYWRSKETIIGPRTELAKEFWDATGKRLYLLTPIEFLRRYQAQGGNVSDQVLEEAEKQGAPTTALGHENEEEGAETARWTPEAVSALLAALDIEAPVQAAVIRAAAANGGAVDRQQVYQLGDYSEKRMLRGFTRPVRRVSRRLQEVGDLDLWVQEMLRPRYDYGVQANAFEIPGEVVEILGEAAS